MIISGRAARLTFGDFSVYYDHCCRGNALPKGIKARRKEVMAQESTRISLLYQPQFVQMLHRIRIGLGGER
jgi:hypothetical protein